MDLRDAVIKVFTFILRGTLSVWLRLAYNIKGYNEKVKNLKAPYILVGNHCLNWDPFMSGSYLKYATRFISSDSLFRDKFVAFLLTYLVGAIPKKKAVSDMKTIKLTLKELKKGHVVGVYPEANRTWNGRSIDILYSTAKFVKLMKVPVVNCMMKGGYLSRPRWSVRGRRGVLELHYEILFTAEDVRKKSVDELYTEMNNAIQYNEYDWQRERMQLFKSKTPAEFLENYLYICPQCKEIGRLESRGDLFRCNNCGLEHRLDNYGFFCNEGRSFENPQEWGDWQEQYFKKIAAENDFIFSDSHAVLYKEDEKHKLHIVAEGTLSLYKDRLEFVSPKTSRTFMIGDIFGNTIQLNCLFDFYYNGNFARFRFFPKNRASAFKWNHAVDYIKKLEEKQDE
ncbi:MAG: 1-acyl-sn-glycerol-3-phosphate acyltransferase [Clostridia bacterium]|nr:1-acyl-sn-glycerol-3-phosphate acyltransferase [Clostridia bacterium]